MNVKAFFLIFLYFTSLHGDFSMRTLKSMPRIFHIPQFLSHEECDRMIQMARPQLKPSTVVDDEHGSKNGVLDSRRSSQGMFFQQNPKDSSLRNIEERIAALTGLPIQNGEAIQVLWYPVGAEYQPHYDYFNPSTPGGAANLSRGGQRVATLIMYLNTPEKGGETIFPLVGVSVIPKKGDALLFYSCTPSGEIDPYTLHGGAPVKGGEKWIATKWIRMGVFR